MGDTNPWEYYAPGLRLRTYQERTLYSFRIHVVVEGKSSFYLVAPPGAGKTLLGLLMAEMLERPALCLSPNAAIQQQWVDRLREHWHCIDSAQAEFQPHPSCSAELTGEGLALVSLTYQKLCVRGRNGEVHPNVLELHRWIKQQGIRTLILDECHHLSAEWGRAVLSLANFLGDVTVIGLTATPVEQDDGPLAELLGKPDHEISLPSVVRAGDLAPFQDLCHIVSPSREEAESLQTSVGRFERLFEEMRRSTEHRFSLESWCEMLELEPTTSKGERLCQVADLLKAEPELVMAWCRYWVLQDRQPPADLPYLPEFYEPATLADRILLAAHYCARAFSETESSRRDPLFVEATEILAEWGYRVGVNSVERRGGSVSRMIGFSRQKLDGMREILEGELKSMGDGLRALVLTDYEFPPAESQALSCVDVMDTLTSFTELDSLDPIMITGKSLLVDDDLWPVFLRTCDELKSERGWRFDLDRKAEGGYWRVEGKGAHWSTRYQVALVTEMLERGISRCLVGTRSLLGEGWDCLRLNTLVDLTVVTSGVAVNQIRGRTLRNDPQDPIKVANNWDLLCLSSVGDDGDLNRLISKHGRLYGVTDDGQIERGIGHLHACFDRVGSEQLFNDRPSIVAMMHARAADRMGARDRWRIGQRFRDQDFPVLSFSPRRSKKRESKALVKVVAPESVGVQLFPRQMRGGRAALAGIVAAGGLATVGFAVAALAATPLWGIGVLASAGAMFWSMKRVTASRFDELGFASSMQSLAKVLLLTIDAEADAEKIEVSERDDGTVRVIWSDQSKEKSESLALALAELVGSLTNPRYILVEEMTRYLSASTFTGELSKVLAKGESTKRVYAVPRLLARKTDAQRLCSCWQKYRNDRTQLLHVDSNEGREIIREFLHRSPLPGEAAIRTLWH
jgi:superfamily II DNA or RNA helicase